MAIALRAAVMGLLAIGLAGCTGYSAKSNFTPPSFPGLGSWGPNARDDGKATVMLSGSIDGLTCAESRIVLARADGDGFKTVDVPTIDAQFGGGAGAVVLDLDPGTYNVVQFACRNGANVVYAGTNPSKNAVPWQSDRWGRSLASFALAGGDVLDAGVIVFAPEQINGFGGGINGRKANLTVRPSAEQELAQIIHDRPELAPKLHSNPMQPGATAKLTLAKCRLTAQASIPKDGSSKLPEMMAEHPEAGAMVQSIGTATTRADGCVVDSGASAGLPALGQ